jgi:hypothetical protein
MEQVQRKDVIPSLQCAFLPTSINSLSISLFLFSQDIHDFLKTYKVTALDRPKLMFGIFTLLYLYCEWPGAKRVRFDSQHGQ